MRSDNVFRTYRLAVRLAAGAAAFVVLLFLVARVVVPSGYLSVSTDLIRPAPFVSAPKPPERLALPIEESGQTVTPIVGDPIYFDLTPPSSFDTVTMRVRLMNDQPMVELGALGSALDEQFEMRPVQNALLDSLDWGQVASGSLSLYQRTHRYASVDEFLRDPPARARVATYRAEAPIPYRLSGYAPSEEAREMEVSLRGSQRMLTYVKDEELHFAFSIQDMNRQPGADPVIVSVYRDGEEKALGRTVLEDDGNVTNDQRSSPLRSIAVTLPSPEEGVYKMELTATPDVFVRRITTAQRKLVFADKLYLGDHVGYSDRSAGRTVYMLGRRLLARTPHTEGLQTLSVGKQKLPLDEPHTKYIGRLPAGAGPTAVVSPKGDVLLESDGLFALSRADLFDPQPLSVNWFTTEKDLDAEDIDFVLTSYEPPGNDGDLRVAEETFEVAKLAKTKEGAYRFIVTAPGLAETQAETRLASVTFIMRRDRSAWTRAWEMLAGRFGKRPAAAPTILSNGRSFGESPQ